MHSVALLGVSTGLAAAAVMFFFGFAAGYITGLWVSTRTNEDLQRGIALLVTFMWMISMTASILIPDYSTSVAIHAIMGSVAGFLFAGDDGLKLLPGRR